MRQNSKVFYIYAGEMHGLYKLSKKPNVAARAQRIFLFESTDALVASIFETKL